MIESVAVELQNQSGPDVIIVDDLEVNQVILIQMIESMGYQAAGVGSGEEALALVKEHLPKLFLLDITMPGMSGFELCEILKNDDQNMCKGKSEKAEVDYGELYSFTF